MKFSGYCFYLNTNIKGDFKICISVPLNILLIFQNKTLENELQKFKTGVHTFK